MEQLLTTKEKRSTITGKLHGLLTSNVCSCFDTQLCKFEEKVCPSRLAGWEFYKAASAGKIVTKTHSDTAVPFEYYSQRLL